MSTQRKRYSAEFKARVALDAVKGLKTVNELASPYGVHPTQITDWKHQRQQEVPDIFSARRDKRQHDQEAFQAQLYQQSGQRKVELDWLKKKLDVPPEAKRALIEAAHPQSSIARQCDLVGLPRATSYDHTQGESAEHLTWMRLLDQQYTDTPYYGIRRMTAWLRSQGYAVHHKRVARLLHTMGRETIDPKPRLRQPHPAHRVYPSLLRGVPITRVNHVWSTDIVSTQMTKTDVLTALAGGDDLADFHLIPGDHHPIDQQFDQLSLLFEGGCLQAGVHALAERRHRGGQAGGFVETMRPPLQFLLLPYQRGLALCQISTAALVLGQRHHAAQVRFGQTLQLLLQTDVATA